MQADEILNRSLSRGLKILQLINRHRSVSLATISKESEVPYPTARRIVRTLIDEGMVEREPNRKRYRPTALVNTLAVGYQLDDDITSQAWPILAETTRRIKWPVYISIKVGARMMVKLSTDTLTTLTFTRHFPGYTTPLQQSASGKAYLGFSSAEHRDMLLGSLFEDSPVGRRARAELEDELALTRDRGYAVAKYMHYTEEPGRTSGISVPIMRPDDDAILATLSLIVFSSAMSVEDAARSYLGELHHAVAQIVKAV